MAGFPMKYSTRIKTLPPYLFAAIDEMKQKAVARGVDIINLGIGDPDLPTPRPIIDALSRAAADPKNHQYPSYEGLLSFRKAVADWYKRRFNVTLDPASEVLTLIGSKEGIGHIPLAFVDRGDVVLVPSPGYPVYPVATNFAGGKAHLMPLTKKNGFLPDLKVIPVSVAKKAKLMFLNSPNNPTSVVMSKEYFGDVIAFAKKYKIIVCHDAAYSEIFYDGRRPASFLEVEGAKAVGIEFHSLSKTYNMTGWRLGFAVGNKQVLNGLLKIKSNLDSGCFQAIQEAGTQSGWGGGNGQPHEGMRRLIATLLINNLSQIEYVCGNWGGRYPDIGHQERFISVGDGFEEFQLRNLAYFAHLYTVEEGAPDMDVGIKIFKMLNVSHGLPIPLAIHFRYDSRVPGDRARTAERCRRVKAAIETRYSDLAAKGLLVSHLTVQDKRPGSPIELIEANATHDLAGH